MLCTPGNLDGRRWDTVGITGPSHAVIHNLLGQVIARAEELGVARPRIGQRPGQDTSYLHPGAAGLEHGALETGLGRREGRRRAALAKSHTRSGRVRELTAY